MPNLESLSPYVIPFIVFVLGICLFVGIIIYYRGKKSRCTVAIDGVCVGFITKYTKDDNTMQKCPVFKVEYRGKAYELCNNNYSRNPKIQVGNKQGLMINPDKPEDFYEPKQAYSMFIICIILGIVFMILPVVYYFGDAILKML